MGVLVANDDTGERVSMTGGPPALILGSDITGLGVLRSLGRAGIPALSMTSAGDPARWSRWFRPAPIRHPDESLAQYLARIPLAGAVLIPCSDQLALATAQLDDALASRFPTSLAPAAVLGTLLDKAPFAESLAALGLPHPLTLVMRQSGDVAQVPEAIWSSAFLKPRDSQAFFARFRVKAFPVKSAEEARDKIERLQTVGFEMMVQEYIPGPASNHYFVDGFVDRHGVIRALFVRRRLRMYPPDFGNSTYMVSVDPEEAAEATATVTRLVQHLGYRGTFSAEFKRDPRDGKFKILEMNARPWWYVEFAQRCGVNIALMMYRDALGLPVTAVERYHVGRSLVFPYYDVYACLAAWRAGRLSLKQWAWSWATSLKPWLTWDDPAPAIRSTSEILARHLWRRERRVG